ncbi:DNA methylase N-4/N-6 domain-containing protein [Natrialba hulunbeirensis JCM 10989]|uniref:Type II methyltransferase n=1 Tax=Natrialba hulunbeirensis JCM 10989 TaxID=1227493 RepID=M0A6P0_9EURY|nr:site-specific DNA-methyltransferase [Natrialba hulunbeirensis]ELY94239.1 DNA methylase N-4/N-6 domain-containing protein [Natrialba hulunbeirensis JCM 10989]
MSTDVDLREFVPDSCADLLEHTDGELKSALPELARDRGRMGEVDQAVNALPSHHELHRGDARDLSMVPDESIELVVTSPPYFDIKDYENGTGGEDQLGDIGGYEAFNDEIDRVWEQCYEKLVPGGRMCIVVGDVLRSRSDHGRHRVLPLHATIQERCTDIGFDNLAPIIWYKIGNSSLEAGGNARFLGKPYEPGAVIKNDIEYILLFRKPGDYRSPTVAERILSLIEADRHQTMFRQLWTDITGEAQTDHPAPYPASLAERLIRMFSFVRDTVLDPFAGSGSTAVGATRCGRDSISVELEEDYFEIAKRRVERERGTLTNYRNVSVETFR